MKGWRKNVFDLYHAYHQGNFPTSCGKAMICPCALIARYLFVLAEGPLDLFRLGLLETSDCPEGWIQIPYPMRLDHCYDRMFCLAARNSPESSHVLEIAKIRT
jgi:hypothetical protein